MTAAIVHLMRPSVRTSLGGGWPVRVLTVLALALPIPLCSALGLSLPLPATVARIAAKLVPFANSAVLDAREEQFLGARGSIVGIPGEPAGNGGISFAAGGPPTLAGTHNAGGGHAPGGKVGGSSTTTQNTTANTPAAEEHGASAPGRTNPIAGTTLPGNSTSTPSTGSTPPPDTGSTPPQGGGNPVPPSAPPTVVDTATGAAATAVGTVNTTVTTATSTAVGTDAPAVDVVNGVVGPLLPPKKP